MKVSKHNFLSECKTAKYTTRIHIRGDVYNRLDAQVSSHTAYSFCRGYPVGTPFIPTRPPYNANTFFFEGGVLRPTPEQGSEEMKKKGQTKLYRVLGATEITDRVKTGSRELPFSRLLG